MTAVPEVLIDPKKRFNLSAYISSLFGINSLAKSPTSLAEIAKRLYVTVARLPEPQTGRPPLRSPAAHTVPFLAFPQEIGKLVHTTGRRHRVEPDCQQAHYWPATSSSKVTSQCFPLQNGLF